MVLSSIPSRATPRPGSELDISNHASILLIVKGNSDLRRASFRVPLPLVQKLGTIVPTACLGLLKYRCVNLLFIVTSDFRS